MAAIRVTVTRKFFQKDLDYIRSRLDKAVELVFPDEFTDERVAAFVDDSTDALLGERTTREILDKGTNLKLIQIPWTGVDRLSFELLRGYNIPVCNSHSNSLVIAEYAVGLLLSIMKHIPLHDRRLRKGEWMRPKEGDPDSFVPSTSLLGKNVCLVGYGAIGQKVAALLSGFSVSLTAVVRRRNAECAPPLNKIFNAEAIPEALREADAVIVAIPLTPKTDNLFDGKLLANMKSDAYFVNISRGKVVDPGALYQMLAEKKIKGAAIDTWYNYPSAAKRDILPCEKYPFHELDNCVLSPHRSGMAEGLLPHLDDSIENCNRLARGEPLINRINLSEKY